MQHMPRSVPRRYNTLFEQLSCKWHAGFVYLDSKSPTHLTLTLLMLQSDLRAEIICQDTCTHAHLTGHRTQHLFQQCPHSHALAFQWNSHHGCSTPSPAHRNAAPPLGAPTSQRSHTPCVQSHILKRVLSDLPLKLYQLIYIWTSSLRLLRCGLVYFTIKMAAELPEPGTHQTFYKITING